MADKRHLHKRIAAFITAFALVSRFASIGLVWAEGAAVTEAPVTLNVNSDVSSSENATSEAEVLTANTSQTTKVTKEEKNASVTSLTGADSAEKSTVATERTEAVSKSEAIVSENSAAASLTEPKVSGMSGEVKTGSVIITSGSETETADAITGPANRRNITIRIKVTGSSNYRPAVILESLFYQVKLQDFTTTIVKSDDVAVINAEVLGEVDMEDQLWQKETYKTGETVMFDAGNLHYELVSLNSRGNECDVELKEYFSVKDFPSEHAVISAYDPADQGKELLPYGTKMKYSVVSGWKLKEMIPFTLDGKIFTGIYSSGGRYFLRILSGDTENAFDLIKTVYHVNTPSVSGLKADINKTGKAEFTGAWKDGGDISVEFSADAVYGSKIFGAGIVDTATGKSYPMTVTGNGKNVTAKISVDDLGDDYTDGKTYRAEVKVIPDTVKINTVVSDGENEKAYKACQFDTAVKDDQKTMLIDPILYENGVAAYIIDWYEANGEKTTVDSKMIFEENKFYEPVEAFYDPSGSVHYKKIKLDTNKNYEVTSNCIKQQKDNIFSVSMTPRIDFIKLGDSDSIKIVLFQTVNQDKIEDMTYSDNEGDVFSLVSHTNSEISALTVNSILYYDNGEFHNMLTKPIYYYVDKHAPEFALGNENGNDLEAELWAKKEFGFTVITDDAEFFNEEVSAGDEVNTVYRNISGSSSPVTEISVGDSVLKKKDGKWTETKASEDQPYSVSVVQSAENEFEVSVTFSSDDKFIEKEFPVTVTDSCGNKSGAQSLKVKFEKISPIITSLKFENAEVYDHPVTGKTAGVGLAARASHPEKAYLDVELKEEGSGLKLIVLNSKTVRGDFRLYPLKTIMDDPESRFTKEGDVYKFRIAVPADVNAMTGITVSAEDTAGNSASYVYDGNGKPLPEGEKGAEVIFDATAPTAELSVSGTPDYTDAMQRKWYSAVPEFAVKSEDLKSDVESGIRFLYFGINGKSYRTDDLSGKDLSGAVISGEITDGKTDIFCTVKTNEDGSVKSDKIKIATLDLSSSDGELKVTVKAADGAGNESVALSETVYIDADAPQSGRNFYIENENDNYRSFGTFLNHGTVLSVDVKEPDGRPSSGLKTAELYLGGQMYKYTFSSEKSSKAEFEIPFDEKTLNAFSGTAVIKVTDNAGNTFVSEKLVSPSGSEDIVFENIDPVIGKITPVNRANYKEGNTEWFDKDAEFTVSVDDSGNGSDYSGLKTTSIAINGKNVVSDDFRKEKNVTPEKKYSFSTADINEENSESYIISIRTEDNAGNTADVKKTVCVDRTAPVITDMEIEGVGSIPSALAHGVLVVPFGHFFRESCTIKVYAEDRNVSSGLASIDLDFYDPYGTRIDSLKAEGDTFIEENGVYSAEFTVPEGFRGYLTAGASDNVGHLAELYRPEGFITENEERHRNTSTLSVTLPETEYTDRDGLPLYSGDINAALKAEDSFSGIKSFEWNASEYGEDKWKHITAGKDGALAGDDLSDFNVSKQDINLVLSLDGRTVLTQDKNAGQFRVKMTDNTGNVSEAEKVFSIDKKPPVVSVSFDSAVADEESGIFSSQRTAVVSVAERNFDPDRINVTADGNEGGVSFGNWSLSSGAEGTDSAVYRMPVTFNGDGSYTLRAEGTDMCDNKSVSYVSENFVIDRTAPVMEVSSSGAEPVNGSFYNGTRTLTVRITEHNFSASRIKITGTKNGSEEDFPKASFTSSGDVHTAVIEFNEDGDYTLSITGMDAAGNALEGYSDSFTVDASAPDIRFNGVSDKSANRGEVSLSADILDDNLAEKNISVQFAGAKRGDLTGKAGIMEETEGGYHFTFAEFPDEQSIDDIYTAVITATDSAGNSTEKTLNFSVNRYGSNYYFDDAALAVAGTYIREPVNIVLHEINVDPLDMEKTMVTVMRDGNPKVLEKDTDYTVDVTGGDGSWCEYCYDIKASNFHDDAAYHVVVMTEDAAGNQNANSMDGKKAEFKFGVDGTPPKCVPINIENGCAMRADKVTVDLFCEDNIMLNTLDVYVNDIHAEEEYEKGSSRYSFTLLSSDEPQTVRIDLTDIAGNKTEMLVENILISTSFLKVAVRSPWVRLAAGTLFCGGVGCGVVRANKKKKRKARYGG